MRYAHKVLSRLGETVMNNQHANTTACGSLRAVLKPPRKLNESAEPLSSINEFGNIYF